MTPIARIALLFCATVLLVGAAFLSTRGQVPGALVLFILATLGIVFERILSIRSEP